MSNSNIAQHVFTIKYTSPEDGRVYDGQFTAKRLSVKDRAMVGVRQSQLCGGMYCVRDDNNKPTGQGIDESTELSFLVIAHLEIALVQKPIWFNLDEITDFGLLNEIYAQVTAFENTFKSRQQTGGPGGLRQENGGPQHPAPNAGDVPKIVVGKEVSAALDA